MQRLIEKHLLKRTSLYQLINDISCFLIHPNLWIRQVIQFIFKLFYCVFIVEYFHLVLFANFVI